jgi:hypothetical protein
VLILVPSAGVAGDDRRRPDILGTDRKASACGRVRYSAGPANAPGEPCPKSAASRPGKPSDEYSPRTFGGIPIPPANDMVNGSRHCQVLG